MSSEAPLPSSKPPCSRADALAVLLRLRRAGHIAYFAGGCVRDELLGLVPKDYDVATDAPPQRVRELFSNTQAVGAAFGVILVRQGHSIVEVATFRSDGAYLDGRRPAAVHFTNPQEDARRRDFTINGLLLDPVKGEVVDYVGGRADLESRTVRAIGDPSARFIEDHLRLLRAVRFAARFGMRIEPATAEAIRAHAAQLKMISPERIAEELRLMWAPPTRNAAWRLLDGFGLLEVIFRFYAPAGQGPGTWPEVFVNLGEAPVPFGLALAAALASRCSEPLGLLAPAEARLAVRALRQALRISNDECDDLEGALVGAGMLLPGPEPSLARKKRVLARATSPLTRRLMAAMAAAGLEAGRIGSLLEELRELAKTDYAPPPLITGDDLVARGLRPGKLFKRVLDAVYDAQLEARVRSKEEAMEMALGLAAGDA